MESLYWHPLGELQQLQQRLNRLVDQLVHPEVHRPLRQTLDWIPALELTETDMELRLKVMLPGINPQNLDIQAHQHSISVAGHLHEVSQAEERENIRSEFYVGRFQRTVPLPTSICPDLVKAKYINGILTLILPKEVARRRQRVKVAVQAQARESVAEHRQHKDHLKETMRQRTSAELEQSSIESIQNNAREIETRQRQNKQHLEGTMHVRADAEVRKSSATPS